MSKNVNLELWENFKEVPEEAKKLIKDGKIKNFTEINPVWRMKKLTEMFGPVGFGWNIKTTKKEFFTNPETSEVMIYVTRELTYFYNGEWSKPIEGSGGAMACVWQNKGIWEGNRKVGSEKVLVSNDEALKMAETDALSVCCKPLGIAADVYFENDATKYNTFKDTTIPPSNNTQGNTGVYKSINNRGKSVTIEDTDKIITEKQVKRLFAISKQTLLSDEDIKADIKERYNYDSRKDFKKSKYDEYCNYLEGLIDDKDFEALSSKLVEKGKNLNDLDGFLKKWELDHIKRLNKSQYKEIIQRLDKISK